MCAGAADERRRAVAAVCDFYFPERFSDHMITSQSISKCTPLVDHISSLFVEIPLPRMRQVSRLNVLKNTRYLSHNMKRAIIHPLESFSA